jgi:hypothetical protein
MTVFGKFDEQWDHSFEVSRHKERPENFSFLSKRTLFFGLNIVGGLNHNPVQVSPATKRCDGAHPFSVYGYPISLAPFHDLLSGKSG